MLSQVACGSNFSLCLGISTGLTVMDEQRMALEDKITMLQQAQTKPKAKRRTSRKKSKKDDFIQAMANAS